MFSTFQREVKQITKNIMELTYFMKGAIQYKDMWLLSYEERELLTEMLKERIEEEVKMYSSIGFK